MQSLQGLEALFSSTRKVTTAVATAVIGLAPIPGKTAPPPPAPYAAPPMKVQLAERSDIAKVPTPAELNGEQQC